MQATSTNLNTPPPPLSSKSKLRKLGVFLALMIVVGSLGAALFWYGQRKHHVISPHKLYNSFEESPSHKKLLTNLNKATQSIIIGKKQHGLFEFVQHLANILTQKGRKVIIQGYTANPDKLLQFSRSIMHQVNTQLGVIDNNTDWIIVSHAGQLIPEQKINQIKVTYPNSKIYIITTNTQQKIKGFKQLQYTNIDPQVFKKSIVKNYKVKENVAEILHQFYESHEQLFQKMNAEQFDHKQHLGESYKPIENLTKQESAILAELCKNGPKKNKKTKELQSLASYGVIFVGDRHFWKSEDALLNYELNTGSNCINKVATEEELKAYGERKLKQEEQRKARQEQKKRKQQERLAAQQKRIQQQQRRIQQQQRRKEQEQRKKEQQEQRKKEESQKLKETAAPVKPQVAAKEKKPAKAAGKAGKAGNKK